MPSPGIQKGYVLVRTASSLVSAGTERAIVDFVRKSLLDKARARPDLVRQVINKAKNDGLLSTLELVRNQLDQTIPVGYSSAGTVIDVGEDVQGFQVGDRVACAGAGYAVHAEVTNVPKNLVVHLPENVDFESGAFTTLGSIALHGLRLAEPQIGGNIAIIGLGLVGLLAVQLAKASGLHVMGFEPNPIRAELARKLGANLVTDGKESGLQASEAFTNGKGFDSVLITAATSSNDPVELAGAIARDRGYVVAVGAVGTELPRRFYYGKELNFRISRSYGPGRYDTEFEEKGHDYPIGYVRWTENRNMQAFLQMMAEHKVDVRPLITHSFTIEKAPGAYELITGKSDEHFIGVAITYPEEPDMRHRVDFASEVQRDVSSVGISSKSPQGIMNVGMLGAGSFASAILLPAMKKLSDVEFVGVCTATGRSSRHVAGKFGFRYCTTDEDEILNSPDVNTVVIATRHNLHAPQVIASLDAGKNVFCEKPLALNESELSRVVDSYASSPSNILMVGFNRRFSPMAKQLKAFFQKSQGPIIMHYRVNAGTLPPDHWAHDPEQGGGRIIGEVCHFVDFLSFLVGAPPKRTYAQATPNGGRYRDDNVLITLEFNDGSIGTIAYVANGDLSYSKERIEVIGDDAVAVLDDFRELQLVRNGKKKVSKSRLRKDKGHEGEWTAFSSALKSGGPLPIPFDEIVATTLTTFRILESLRSRSPVEVDLESFMESVSRKNCQKDKNI